MRMIRMVLILLVIAGCAATEKELLKANDTQTVRPNDFGSVEYELGDASLSAETINFFEQKVPQRFRELVEYMKIAADENINKEFKLEAYEAMNGYLLLDSGVQISKPSDQVIAAFLERNHMIVANQADDIAFEQNFSQVNTNFYQSFLSLRLANDTAQNVKVLLINVEKKFGSETHRVWEIRFSF